LDRFLMRVNIGYPAQADEVRILAAQTRTHPIGNVQAVQSADELVALQDAVRGVFVHESIQNYIVEIVSATREHAQIANGASPRGSLALLHAAQAYAAVQGRAFVLPDDVKTLGQDVLAHRIVLSPEARARGIADADLIGDLLNRVPVPVGVAKQ
jgi:MoxR-like ATPase